MDQYKGLLHYTRVGVMYFWRRILDELMVFTQRPFLDCERWRKDWKLQWAQSKMWLFGKSMYVVEHYVPHWVARQFGDVQDVVGYEQLYPRITREVGIWGQAIIPFEVRVSWEGVVTMIWDDQARIQV